MNGAPLPLQLAAIATALLLFGLACFAGTIKAAEYYVGA